MPQAMPPKPDAAVAGVPDLVMWVLVQISPRFEVLAASDNRNRLIREMAEAYGVDHDRGLDRELRYAVRITNLLIS